MRNRLGIDGNDGLFLEGFGQQLAHLKTHFRFTRFSRA
jgi:hypothetical protein